MSQLIPPLAMDAYRKHLETDAGRAERADRKDRLARFAQWSEQRLRNATRDDLIEFLGPLWSLRMWGNRAVYVDQVIDDNTLEATRNELATLLWGKQPIEARWDDFRAKIKRIGPAVMSESLSHLFPAEYIPWTGVTQRIYQALGIPDVPRQSYQVDGATFARLAAIGAAIAREMRGAGLTDADVMSANYLVWWLNENEHFLPGAESVGPSHSDQVEAPPTTGKAAAFLHNDVRDKIADIGRWLGLQSQTEVKVANGAVVDVIWESTIGNMGRVIYVFEVQTRGSIDSLLMNLMKSLNNPAVQGVVAVSDTEQIARIEHEAAGLRELRDKLKT